MGQPKRADGVESLLRHADATLEDWFRQSRVTTHQASVVFARFLRRAKRQGAGALRHQVDDLQAGLKRLSAGLQQVEKARKPGATKARRPVATRQPARPRKAKKAA